MARGLTTSGRFFQIIAMEKEMSLKVKLFTLQSALRARGKSWNQSLFGHRGKSAL